MATSSTRYETCLSYSTIVLCTALVMVTVYGVLTLPDRIPTHFRLSGEADHWGKPTSLLALPVICLLIEGLLRATYRIPPELMNFPGLRTPANVARQVKNIRHLTATLQPIVAALFLALASQWIWIATHAEPRPKLWIPFVFIGLLLTVTGVFIVRAYRLAEHS